MPNPINNNREIRVFLSSTFRDMEKERDYLLKHVFPKLRQECAERNVGFTEIDLRWGITEAAAKNGMTIEICLGEIDRCREYPPFFIGFLGERYGWIPQASELQEYWNERGESDYSARIRDALQRGISVTELEIRFGVLDPSNTAALENACFFLRDAALTAEFSAAAADSSIVDFYDDGGGKLQALKTDLRASGRLELDGYQDVAAFGERVLELLLSGLDARYPAQQGTRLAEQYAQAHARFAQSRRHSYVPLLAMRERMRGELAQRLRAEGATPDLIYVTGPSGGGKSAFMADLAEWLPGQFPQALVYDRYCGADNGHDIAMWRDALLETLRQGGAQGLRHEDDNARWQSLMQALELMPRPGPICLMIDAVDQLHDPEQALRILGELAWPAGVAVVVSGLPEFTPARGYTVVALDPPSEELCVDIIESFTANYRKALASDLVGYLARNVAGRPPLFLRMVLEDLRVHGRHETLGAELNVLLDSATPETLFAHFLDRWNGDYVTPGHATLAAELAALLAAARTGLDETELADLLATAGDPISTETGSARLPSALLKPVLAVLRPYLMRDEGRERLMHNALVRAVPPPEVVSMRRRIAAHFSHRTPRAVAERIYQHTRLGAERSAHGADDALYRVLSPLDDILMLRENDYGVARDALSLLGAGAGTEDGPAGRLGHAWASQLELGCDATTAARANHWLLTLMNWAFHTCALPLAERLLLVRRAGGDDDPAQLAVSLSNLAMLHLQLGDQARAEPLLLEALALNRANEDLDIVYNLRNLSVLYSTQGRMAEAELLAKESLVYRRRFLPDAPEQLASSLQGLGVISVAQGELEQACAYIEEARDVLRRGLPPGHEAMAACLNNLGEVYRHLGRVDDADAAYSEALAIRRRALSAGHPKIAAVLNNLGALRRQTGALAAAAQLFTEACTILYAALPPNHPDIASCLNNLGAITSAMEAYEEAEALYGEALRITRIAVAPGHPDLAGSLNNLGVLYLKQGRDAEAEPLLLEALEILRAALPEKHPNTQACLNSLIALYQQTGEKAKIARLRAAGAAPAPPPPEEKEDIDFSSPFSAGAMRLYTKAMDMMFKRADPGATGDQLPNATGEFGKVPSNPIPCRGIAEYHAYFRALRTIEGGPVQYDRRGSMKDPVSDNPIDVYEVRDAAGAKLATLYLSAYARKTSNKAPLGFILGNGGKQ